VSMCVSGGFLDRALPAGLKPDNSGFTDLGFVDV